MPEIIGYAPRPRDCGTPALVPVVLVEFEAPLFRVAVEGAEDYSWLAPKVWTSPAQYYADMRKAQDN